MWALQPRDDAERTLARLALLAAVAGAVRLEELGEYLRREEHRAWWAGHGRDVINGAAVLVLSAGLVLLGFPAPAAFLGGGLMTLTLTGVSALEARLPERLHPRAHGHRHGDGDRRCRCCSGPPKWWTSSTTWPRRSSATDRGAARK